VRPDAHVHLGRGLEEELSSRLPAYESTIGVRAPIIWRILALEVGVAKSGGVGPKVLYRWQRPLVLTHVKMMARSGLDADLAGLQLSWEDGRGNQVPTTGRFPTSLPGLAISSSAQWLDIEIPVLHNEIHSFQVTNLTPGDGVTVPELFFLCVERDAP
jgi:hypothetical protein